MLLIILAIMLVPREIDKIGFLILVFSVALTSFALTQSFAEKSPIEGFERLVSTTDPGMGHEQHQLAVIIPINGTEFSGTLHYSASEPIQLVALKGPLAPGEEAGKMIWTPDGETIYELILVDHFSSYGEWNFVGNALALHTFKTTPFVVDYKVEYSESESRPILTGNSVNDINIIAQFNFAKQTIEIESFNVFKQISGFDGEAPQIILQGVVGIEKSLLYRAADTQYHRGFSGFAEHNFSDFAMSVYLKQGDIPIRKITFRECDITNYTIDTLHDNDYSYNQFSVFVVVDNFEISCGGMTPYHYDYQEYIDVYGLDDVMKMDNMKISPKMYNDYNLDG